jgi:hypothetical protein
MKTPEKKMKPLSLVEKAGLALRRAVAKLIAVHERTGEPIVIGRNGKVIELIPQEMPLRETPVEYRTRRK